MLPTHGLLCKLPKRYLSLPKVTSSYMSYHESPCSPKVISSYLNLLQLISGYLLLCNVASTLSNPTCLTYLTIPKTT